MALDNSDDLKRAFLEALKESGRRVDITADLEDFNKALARNKTTYSGLISEMIRGRKVYRDFSDKIEELDEQIKNLGDAAGDSVDGIRDELKEKKKALTAIQAQTARQQALIDSITGTTKAFTTMAGSLIGIAGRTMGGFASGIQSGASAFSLAGGLMEGAIDGMNAGAHMVGNTLQATGSAASMLPGKFKYVGVAATLLGGALNATADAAAAAAKFIVSYMMKQLEMTVDSYNKMAASGALFSNGMTGMYNAARNAGLTINQLSNVVTKNADVFAQSGLGIGGTIQMVGKVGAVMKSTGMADNLLKLGYGFEEQAQLVGEVMADMRRANSDKLKDPAGIARATEQYAMNLRVIASITGEDARKKLEEARAQSANIAFRAKLMELEKSHPDIYKNTMAAMSSMSDVMRQSVMEQVLFGGVINQAGAVIAATSQGFASGVKGTASAIVSGNIATAKGLEENQKLQGRANDQFREEFDKFISIGIAGMAGGMQDINAALQKQILNSDRISENGVLAAQEAARKMEKANDGLTNGVVSAAHAAQQLALDIQDKVLPELTRFALFSTVVLAALDDGLREFYKAIGKEKEGPSLMEDLTRYMEFYTTIGAASGAGIGMLGFGAGAAPGAAIGYGAGAGAAVVHGLIDRFTRKTGSNYQIPDVIGDRPKVADGINRNGLEGVGKITPDLQKALDKMGTSSILKGATITSLNDATTFAGHQYTGSKHAEGRAMDIKIPGYDAKPGTENNSKETLKRSEEIKAALISLGFKHVDDEYIKPSKNANGGHFHAELKDGAVVRANPGGTTVNVGEGGQDELVTPLKNGRIPGMDELIKRVEELIQITKDHKDVSENIFIANQ